MLDLGQPLLGLGLTGGQVALGLLAALRQVGLELQRGLGGLGAGLLEEGVRLLALVLRVLVGLGAQLGGVALGLVDDPQTLVLRLGLAVLGVVLGLGADLLGGGLGELAVLLGGAVRLLAQVLGLLLGEAQDLLDPGAETGVRRLRLGDRRLGGLGLQVEFLDALLECADPGQGTVTVGHQLGDPLVDLGTLVPTAHQVEAVRGVTVAHGVLGFLSSNR